MGGSNTNNHKGGSPFEIGGSPPKEIRRMIRTQSDSTFVDNAVHGAHVYFDFKLALIKKEILRQPCSSCFSEAVLLGLV